MLAADLRQAVVGEPRQIRRDSGPADKLERRIGERQHLREVAELVEQTQPRIDVHQRLQPRKRGGRDGWPGMSVGKPIEIGFRHEVIEYVDDHSAAV